jgi:uncharacterized protein YlaI
MRSWENGSYICAECHDEFDQDELTEVIGGIEVDDAGVEHLYGIFVCEECYKRRADETAARLLHDVVL